jgi:hypothetical protein
VDAPNGHKLYHASSLGVIFPKRRLFPTGIYYCITPVGTKQKGQDILFFANRQKKTGTPAGQF